nr:hypothetical protein [Dechloromonas sp.]
MGFDIDAWAKSPERRRFIYFDPVLTYSTPGNYQFVSPRGEPCGDLNSETGSLFRIGQEIFSRLTGGEEVSKDDFLDGYADYWNWMDEFRAIAVKWIEQGKLSLQTIDGQALIDIASLDQTQMASLCWQRYLTMGVSAKEENADLFRQIFLFHALFEIDNALIGIALGDTEAALSAIEAANALNNAISIESGSESQQEIRRDMAYRGAMEKLKRDPKQRAKIFVKECWNEWQIKPSNYKNKSAFAKDMLSKFDELDSQTVITRWCSQWEKEAANSI